MIRARRRLARRPIRIQGAHMPLRQAALLLLLGVAGLAGCSVLGDAAVDVETGNQPVGYVSRPLSFTTSSDESVQHVAQRICSNVRPGSYASVTFVGKEPAPGPLDPTDWGRYRYECQTTIDAAPAAASAAPAAPPAVSAPVPAPVAAATPAPVPAPIAAAAPAVPPAPAAADESHRRECQRRQGAYQVCLGSCLLNSTSPSAVVASQCEQSCAPNQPVACN